MQKQGAVFFVLFHGCRREVQEVSLNLDERSARVGGDAEGSVQHPACVHRVPRLGP